MAAAHDDPGADVDVQAAPLLARAAAAARAGHGGQLDAEELAEQAADRVAVQPELRDLRSSRRSEALGPDPAGVVAEREEAVGRRVDEAGRAAHEDARGLARGQATSASSSASIRRE